MPRIVLSGDALLGIRRCRTFLAMKNARAAASASAIIQRHLRALATHPELGRPVGETPHVRELTIPYGDAGYCARNRYDPEADTVLITAFRHQREAGY